MPKPVKAGDGKLKGLTIPMVGSQLSGYRQMPGKSGNSRKMGKFMKKLNKMMTVLLAVSMVCLTGITSFADESHQDGVEQAPCLTCVSEEEGHVHDDSCYTHTWDDGKVEKAATCTEEGKTLFTCTAEGCGSTRTESIPSGHTWDDGEEITPATCTEKGEKKYTCSAEGCGAVKNEDVEALGHDWDEGTITDEATDTTDGLRTFTCKREGCTATKTEVIPAKYTYKSGQTKWKTDVISFAPTSEGIRYEITYASRGGKTYSQAEIDAMSKNEIKANRLFISKITYTIPEDFEANTVNIFMGDAINDAANYMLYVPGDAAPIQIAIVNLSSHDYAYKKGSFAVTTEAYQQYFDKNWATPTESIGFDGQRIPYEYLAVRSKNAAIQSLYGVTGTSKVKDAQMTDAALGAKLTEVGYANGIYDLHKYYLDYYNDKKNTSYTALEQLPDSDIAALLTSGNKVSAKETNVEISELLYNYYYNHLYSLTPAGAGYPGDTNNDYTVGSLMRAYQNGQPSMFDDVITQAWGQITASAEDQPSAYLWEGFEAWINGPDTQNTYQDYNYGFTAGFSFESTDTVYSVVTNYYTSADGGAPVLDGSVARAEQIAVKVGEEVRVKPEDSWNTYDGKDYKLEDPAKLSLVAVADPASNVISLNYYRNVASEVIIPTPNPDTDQPLPPDEHLPEPDPTPDPDQPLPPDDHLEDPDQPDNPSVEPLPPDDHLKDADHVKSTKSDDPDQPRTGDEAQLALYLLLAVGTSGFLAVIIKKRAKKISE